METLELIKLSHQAKGKWTFGCFLPCSYQSELLELFMLESYLHSTSFGMTWWWFISNASPVL